MLHRLLHAVAALPPVGTQVEKLPGRWCHSLPLWGNPLLLDARGGLEVQDAGALLSRTKLRTVGDAIAALAAVAACASTQEHLHRSPALLGDLVCLGLTERWRAEELLLDLLNAVPENWCDAALAAATAEPEDDPPPPAVEDVVEDIVERVGWQVGQKHYLLANYTVKVGTQLILQHQGPRPQQQKLETFAKIALPSGTADMVRQMLRRMWALPWENERKEVLWRLALNGLPTAARMDKDGEGCPCGTAFAADRSHNYFACPAARAVVAAVEAELTGDWAMQETRRLDTVNVWLATPPFIPGQVLHQGVWDVVCLCILNAMDMARQLLYKRRADAHLGEELAASVGRCAVAKFWSELANFCGLNMVPQQWQAQVPAGHPFLRWNVAAQRWQVCRAQAGVQP